MPHRGRRRDQRREWILTAAQILAADLDPGEDLMGMTVITRDAGGVVGVHSFTRGAEQPDRVLVADLDTLHNLASATLVKVRDVTG
jgi:hypothetical protein